MKEIQFIADLHLEFYNFGNKSISVIKKYIDYPGDILVIGGDLLFFDKFYKSILTFLS